MSVIDVPAVETYKPLIEAHIQRLSEAREDSDVDAPILEPDCEELLEQIREIRNQGDSKEGAQIHNAAVETVFREIFVDVVASVDISEPAFAQVWVLLDIITVLSDNDLCEPGLSFWLIEELLDSQTIDGCRKVFDYLESRRERITAKHFKLKNLVILRCCNELLRRLSRAEDTVLCGRVFIFLFQSFPLGDKSSVNLRGEFHVENVTTFDPAPKKSADAIKPMELDTDTPQATSGAQTPASNSQSHEQESMQKTARNTPVPKAVKSDTKDHVPPDLDTLYPKFWSLQSLFSSPTKLFEPSNMAMFKDGIAMTLSCFKSVSNSSAPSTNPSDIQRGLKRKRTNTDTSSSTSTFNPKYLTNRDLFDLEVHDIAFRRHILVQALIMIDFLLSLAPAAKAKFEGLTNKSVLYSYTLSEEDTKWAQSTRASIASYLQQGNGNEGKFYYRMVDTVLSRDKNWVRWKAENCPSISHDGVSVQTYLEAKETLTKLTEAQKEPLPNPPGAGDLAFLSKIEPLETLKRPSKRHKVPTMEEYYRGIETDNLDMDFATEEEKKEIEERKAGRVWRALRASGRRFVLCEKVQYGGDLRALIEGDVEAEADGTAEKARENDNKNANENGEGTKVEVEGEGEGEKERDNDGEGEAEGQQPEPDIGKVPSTAEEPPSTEAEEAAPEEDRNLQGEDAEMTDVAPVDATATAEEGNNAIDDDTDRDSGETE
ncbi:uncharacterized protein Z518_04709 [Rhinocladiella mackenziei CBS 650.93]|uniref:Nuclear matrix protein n=1 Tax=Rhinocladiella mackenziei CBS 650.93 TaxID=1442369 RepID=A0A0D2H8F0_9EURO|nr:uncharacterized protein Z518_04709 [Rhinocladiella mackenziei CBS 650.93]KIX06733.1 hypothetical protein Z518_04709 [Rhinocladiella mackenziei CBS 650.93]